MADETISLANKGYGYDSGYTPYAPPGGPRTPTNRGAVGNEGVMIPPPKKNEFNYEEGVPYYLPFVTPYKGSWEIIRDDKVTIWQLIDMRRKSGQARALYRLVTMPILAALQTAHFVPADNVEGGQDEAVFVEQMLTLPPEGGGMITEFEKVIAQMLLALFTGFSAFELVYWVPIQGPLAGKVTLKKISYRPSETVEFLVDNNTEFDGLRQRTYLQGRVIDVKIDGKNVVYFANQEEERPFYGVSLFETAWYHFDKVQRLDYLMGLAAQRSAVGLKIGTMPPDVNAQDQQNFQRALGNLGLSPYIILPSEAWTVQVVNEGGAHFDFLGVINYHLNQMSKSVLAQWFDEDTGNGQNGGTTVDFSRQDDSLFIMMLQKIMRDVEKVINHQIAPRFINWNFGTGKYPTFRFGPFTDEQRSAIQTTFNTLAAALVASPDPTQGLAPEFWRALQEDMGNKLGLPIDWDTVKLEWEKDDAQQDELKQLQFEQQVEILNQPVAPPAGPGNPGAPAPGKTNSGNPRPNTPPKQVSPKVQKGGA